MAERGKKQTSPVSTAADGRDGGSWLELVTSVVYAPVGLGRAQAERLAGLDRFLERRIEVVLNRLNIPSRSDIERLNRSVDTLTAKVEALIGRHERSGH